MKWILALAVPLLAAAQTVDTYTYNGNGERVPGAQIVIGADSRTERVQSINGRTVPIERVEEHVLRSDANGKVTERIIHRYNPEGQPVDGERIVIEEQIRPDGSTVVRANTYQSDLNGNARLVERSTAETRKTATGHTSDITVDKPSVNGSLEMAERRVVAELTSGTATTEDTTVYRRDENGQFFAASKQAVERTMNGNETQESITRYEAMNPASRLTLSGVTLKKATKRTDGGESVVVDVYGTSTPGLANSDTGKPRLREQQVIEREPRGNQVVETLSVRRPSVADPDRLGPAHRVSETVCTGKCK